MAENELTAQARNTRAQEQWLRYDSIVIGPGARDINQGWFNTFSEFANADELTWFTSGRNRDVGTAYANISDSQEDWAQVIYQTGIEFIAPLGFVGFSDQGVEASGVLQNLFVTELSKRMAFNVVMMDTDTVATIPGIHAPGATGIQGRFGITAGVLTSDAGNTGDGNVTTSWKWPNPLQVPARSKITVRARIDKPIVELLRQLDASPGSVTIPVPQAGSVNVREAVMRNWYAIRVWHRGPRFVQLRAARSAS